MWLHCLTTIQPFHCRQRTTLSSVTSDTLTFSLQSSEDSPADTRPSHLAKAFCATPYSRLFPSIRCLPLTLTPACLPDTVTSLLPPIVVVHYVSQATNRGFYLPHVPGLPPPPKAEERPLATALKQLIFGVSSPDVSFARVMCSQTHEKVPHFIVRHTENAEGTSRQTSAHAALTLCYPHDMAYDCSHSPSGLALRAGIEAFRCLVPQSCYLWITT